MELDNLLWRDSDHIAVKQLWEYLCTYCYLPRLADENVLITAIQTGVNSTEYFSYASGFDGTRYIDLKYNQSVASVERSGYLVKNEVAARQLVEEARKRQEIDPVQTQSGASITVVGGDPNKPSIFDLPIGIGNIR